MSNKLQNRVLLPNGQFISFPEEKLESEVKYEQRKEEEVEIIKEALEEKPEKSITMPASKSLKTQHNAKAKKENTKLKEKQDNQENKI